MKRFLSYSPKKICVWNYHTTKPEIVLPQKNEEEKILCVMVIRKNRDYQQRIFVGNQFGEEPFDFWNFSSNRNEGKSPPSGIFVKVINMFSGKLEKKIELKRFEKCSRSKTIFDYGISSMKELNKEKFAATIYFGRTGNVIKIIRFCDFQVLYQFDFSKKSYFFRSSIFKTKNHFIVSDYHGSSHIINYETTKDVKRVNLGSRIVKLNSNRIIGSRSESRGTTFKVFNSDNFKPISKPLYRGVDARRAFAVVENKLVVGMHSGKIFIYEIKLQNKKFLLSLLKKLKTKCKSRITFIIRPKNFCPKEEVLVAHENGTILHISLNLFTIKRTKKKSYINRYKTHSKSITEIIPIEFKDESNWFKTKLLFSQSYSDIEIVCEVN